MNTEITFKKRQHLLFSKTSIALIVFIATMIFFSYQVSYAQLDSPNNIKNSTSINNISSSISSNNSSINNLTYPPSLIENGNVSFGSFSSFVNDINSFLASSSSKSISNSTNSQTKTPLSYLLTL